jgi:hypothetical protein
MRTLIGFIEFRAAVKNDSALPLSSAARDTDQKSPGGSKPIDEPDQHAAETDDITWRRVARDFAGCQFDYIGNQSDRMVQPPVMTARE